MEADNIGQRIPGVEVIAKFIRHRIDLSRIEGINLAS